MLAPLNWPAALMTMDCRLPFVASERLAVPDTDSPHNVPIASISRPRPRMVPVVRLGLLPGRFPPTAARYASRCPIPFPRSGVAVELAICICARDRDPYKPFTADAAGN